MGKARKAEDPEMLPEYDFSKGVRNKYAEACRKGYRVKINKPDGSVTIQNYILQKGSVILEPDVRKFFPDSEAVNEALRALIKIIPKSRRAKSAKGITQGK